MYVVPRRPLRKELPIFNLTPVRSAPFAVRSKQRKGCHRCTVRGGGSWGQRGGSLHLMTQKTLPVRTTYHLHSSYNLTYIRYVYVHTVRTSAVVWSSCAFYRIKCTATCTCRTIYVHMVRTSAVVWSSCAFYRIKYTYTRSCCTHDILVLYYMSYE